MAVYGSSKAALNKLTNAMADELWGSGVRVNTVEPRGGVMTEGATALLGSLPDDQIESLDEMVEAGRRAERLSTRAHGPGSGQPRPVGRARSLTSGPN